jgi:hypothetical protein
MFAFNDHSGAMKSIMGEITDSTNRAQSYALLPAAWSFGTTVGFVTDQFYVIIRFFD